MTRPVQRRRAVHAEVSARLKSHPRMWLPVGTYPTDYSARARARVIETSYNTPCYLPVGSFEARTQPAGDRTAVVARYVGVKP